MRDSENLILAVERYPCIWDINHVDYHNRDKKVLAWEQICKEVDDDWDACTDKTNRCAEMKKKWTNIRDYYRKEIQKIKNSPTGSAAKKSKKYVYGDLLYFLTPIFSRRDSEENHLDTMEETYLEESEDQDTEPEDVYDRVTPVVKVLKKEKEDVSTQIFTMLQEKQNNTAVSYNDSEDDDTKFLLSFRTYMKNMNTEQKLDFKMGMLQLAQKIIIKKSPSQSSHPQLYSD